MKERKFKTNSNSWQKIDSTVIVILFIISIIFAFVNASQYKDVSYGLAWGATFLMVILSCIPIIMIYLAIRIPVKRNQRKNIIFEVVDDIDYYRDNLGEISPGLMSFMIDLDVENKKDITAMLLYFKTKNIIGINNNQIKINENYDINQLKESDLIFFNWLKNGGHGYPVGWRESIEKEAYQEGYIRPKEKNKITGCLLPIILQVVIMGLIVFLVFSLANQNVSTEAQMEFAALSEDASFNEVLTVVFGSAELLGYFIKAILVLILIVVWGSLPLFRFVYFIAANMSKTRIRRTKLGNELTEKIYAMKNFINDFGNLSDATKEHLVLWDFFLIYAVVLEENNKIIDELSRYKKVNINNFVIDKNNGLEIH